MRRTAMVLMAGLMLGVACPGCDGSTVGFDITQEVPAQTIHGDAAAHAAASAAGRTDALALDWTMDSPPQDTTGAARVDLETMTFTVTAGPCWDFVKGATVSVESTRNGTTLPRQTIAQGTSPGCVNVFALAPVAGIDLQPYADEGFRLTTHVTGIPPAADVTFTGHVVLRAGVL